MKKEFSNKDNVRRHFWKYLQRESLLYLKMFLYTFKKYTLLNNPSTECINIYLDSFFVRAE